VLELLAHTLNASVASLLQVHLDLLVKPHSSSLQHLDLALDILQRRLQIFEHLDGCRPVIAEEGSQHEAPQVAFAVVVAHSLQPPRFQKIQRETISLTVILPTIQVVAHRQDEAQQVRQRRGIAEAIHDALEVAQTRGNALQILLPSVHVHPTIEACVAVGNFADVPHVLLDVAEWQIRVALLHLLELPQLLRRREEIVART